MNLPEFGTRISLISHAGIRYMGRFYAVDIASETMTLYNVRAFGSEERVVPIAIPPNDGMYDFVSFRGMDIQDLWVVDNHPSFNDPAIIQAVNHSSLNDPAIIQAVVSPIHQQLPVNMASNNNSLNIKQPNEKVESAEVASSIADVPSPVLSDIKPPAHEIKIKSAATRSSSSTGVESRRRNFSKIAFRNQKEHSSGDVEYRQQFNPRRNDNEEQLDDRHAIYNRGDRRSRSRVPSRSVSYGRNQNQSVSGGEFRCNLANKEKANKSFQNWRSSENFAVRRSSSYAPIRNSQRNWRNQSKRRQNSSGDKNVDPVPNGATPDKENELSKNDWRRMFPRSYARSRSLHPNLMPTCCGNVPRDCLQNHSHNVTLRYDSEFDFEQANSALEELTNELTSLKMDVEPKPEELNENTSTELNTIATYDKKKSFFDNLDNNVPQATKNYCKQSRLVNVETFGDEATRRRKRGQSYKNMNNGDPKNVQQDHRRSEGIEEGSPVPSKRINCHKNQQTPEPPQKD